MSNTRNINLASSNLGIFLDTIISDFGTILNNNMTMIDMVERCINKKQYQQALTFLESAFPDFYRNNNIISFSSDPKKNSEIFNEFLKNNIRFNSPRRNVNRFCSMLERGMEEDKIIKNHIDLGEEANKRLYCEIKKSKAIIDQKYDFINDILPVLKMHKTLKKIRNLFSHGNGKNRPNVNYLSIYIKYYLKVMRNLVEKTGE